MSAIAVDAMGGDLAPQAEVAGAIAAAVGGAVRVVLVGDETVLRDELKRQGHDTSDAIAVHHASQRVTMDDHAGKAFKQKPDSSLRIAAELIKSGAVDGMVSAGNSGAVMAHCLLVLKRIPGVERPGIVSAFPTPAGSLVMCDMGANVEVKPLVLAQFGVLGALYDRVTWGHAVPRVGLLSNGSEAHKGTDLTRRAHLMLTEVAKGADPVLEYRGYIEGNDLFGGDVDVVATDGFTGNIVLKVSEGVSETMFRFVRDALGTSMRSRLGAFLAKPALMALRKKLHYSEAGGALLLGVAGLVTICHGRSDPMAIKNAILATARAARAGLVKQVGDAMLRHESIWRDCAPPALPSEGTA